MSNPHGPSGPHVEVDDPAAAMRKTEDFGRRILSVPKTRIEKKAALRKTANKKTRKST
jgi:hypothetical protein